MGARGRCQKGAYRVSLSFTGLAGTGECREGAPLVAGESEGAPSVRSCEGGRVGCDVVGSILQSCRQGARVTRPPKTELILYRTVPRNPASTAPIAATRTIPGWVQTGQSDTQRLLDNSNRIQDLE